MSVWSSRHIIQCPALYQGKLNLESFQTQNLTRVFRDTTTKKNLLYVCFVVHFEGISTRFLWLEISCVHRRHLKNGCLGHKETMHVRLYNCLCILSHIQYTHVYTYIETCVCRHIDSLKSWDAKGAVPMGGRVSVSLLGCAIPGFPRQWAWTWQSLLRHAALQLSCLAFGNSLTSPHYFCFQIILTLPPSLT